jgi:hypothetical protein
MVFNGTDREGDTPVPIPNTEVKPLIADGTARFAVWESRTVPVFPYITCHKKSFKIIQNKLIEINEGIHRIPFAYGHGSKALHCGWHSTVRCVGEQGG